EVAGGTHEGVVLQHVEDAGNREQHVVLAHLGLVAALRATLPAVTPTVAEPPAPATATAVLVVVPARIALVTVVVAAVAAAAVGPLTVTAVGPLTGTIVGPLAGPFGGLGPLDALGRGLGGHRLGILTLLVVAVATQPAVGSAGRAAGASPPR